jgi:hypothetical protein
MGSSSPGNVIFCGGDAAMHEDLVNGHSCPCTSGEGDNDNNCAITPNEDNQLEEDGEDDMAMCDNLINGHSCPHPSDKHDNVNNCATTPNNDNHLDKAVLMMMTIDPVVCRQQSTNDGRKRMKRRQHSMVAMSSGTQQQQG